MGNSGPSGRGSSVSSGCNPTAGGRSASGRSIAGRCGGGCGARGVTAANPWFINQFIEGASILIGFAGATEILGIFSSLNRFSSVTVKVEACCAGEVGTL